MINFNEKLGDWWWSGTEERRRSTNQIFVQIDCLNSLVFYGDSMVWGLHYVWSRASDCPAGWSPRNRNNYWELAAVAGKVTKSRGRGKMIVLFFSADILFNVWKYNKHYHTITNNSITKPINVSKAITMNKPFATEMISFISILNIASFSSYLIIRMGLWVSIFGAPVFSNMEII